MDNYFQNCPPMMADGRFLTDYRTATRREESIKYINGIVRDDEYRMFLQQNAEKIADNEWSFLRAEKSCWNNECLFNSPTRVDPASYHAERVNYDNVRMKHGASISKCEKFDDYRMSITPKSNGVPSSK